jgi:hypothetical protein
MEASEEDETERDRRLAVEAQDREFARVLQVRYSLKVIIKIFAKNCQSGYRRISILTIIDYKNLVSKDGS